MNRVSELTILSLYLIFGVIIINFLSPSLGNFADEAPRIGDAIANSDPENIFQMILSKELWLGLHPPFDQIFRTLITYPFIEFFDVSNKSIIILQKSISFIFLTFMSYILILCLVMKENQKTILIISLTILPSIYIFQLGSIYSLTTCTAGFFLYLSFFYLIRNKDIYDIWKSSILIAIATLFRPEVLLFVPAFILYVFYFNGFIRSLLSSIIIIFPETLRLFIKKIYSGDISYFEFSSRYILPEWNITNSLSLIIEKSYLSFFNSPILSFLTISIFLFFIIWRCYSLCNSNNRSTYLFIVLVYVTYLILLVSGYMLGIGRPEPRNIIYLLPLFIVPFSIYINTLSLKFMNYSIRNISLVVIIIFSCFKSIHTYSYFDNYQKYHMAKTDELHKLLVDVDFNKGILIDYLYFHEWKLRAHFITPSLASRFCSYDRCKNKKLEITMEELNPYLKVGRTVLPKHDEFNLHAFNFIANEDPRFIVALNKPLWDKYYDHHMKTNLSFHSIVNTFAIHDNNMKSINFNFTKIKNYSYTMIRSTKNFRLYEKQIQ
jgi:hypothetical protein